MKCFKWKNGDKRNNVFDVYFLLCNFLDQERQFRNFNRFHSMIKTHPRLYIYIYIKAFKRSTPFVEATLASASCIRQIRPSSRYSGTGCSSLRKGSLFASRGREGLIQVISSRIISRLLYNKVSARKIQFLKISIGNNIQKSIFFHFHFFFSSKVISKSLNISKTYIFWKFENFQNCAFFENFLNHICFHISLEI